MTPGSRSLSCTSSHCFIDLASSLMKIEQAPYLVTVMGLQGGKQGTEHPTLRGNCVEGQSGGNLITNSNCLKSVTPEYKKPFAVRGPQGPVMSLFEIMVLNVEL